MDGEGFKLWRCPACDRVLLQRSVEYARRRLRSQVASGKGASADFVREAMWPAYLASLRRCRCGSRKRLRAVPAGALRGQLDLHLEAVVLQ
ncbi:MAG: hypothetical protein NVS2B9_21770 [Myxococcales bacterium]